MPDLNDLDAPAARRPGTAEHGTPSRRSVLRGAAGAAAAGIAATSLTGVVDPAGRRTRPRTGSLSPADAAVTDAIVLHVRDAAAGEIDIFRGTSQVRLHDRGLAAQIVRASR